MEKNILTICVPSKSEMCTLTTCCILGIQNDPEILSKCRLRLSLCLGQSDLPKLRSEQLSEWYRTAKKGDIFMFIDADQTFTPKDILKSLDFLEKHDVVCGAYCKKSGGITVTPFNYINFYKDREGELYYGSTGFMMMRYDIVDKIAKTLGKELWVSRNSKAYPFFYERVVDDPVLSMKDQWLSEDYSFCWLVKKLEGSVYGYISDTIGHILPIEKFVSELEFKIWEEKSIVVFCSNTKEAWSPKNLEKGIGGSETAVIYLTREWVKHGYKVTVYCTTDNPGEYDGVNYISNNEFNPIDVFDILIVWRNVHTLETFDFKARKILLDLHDVVKDKISTKLLQKVSKICVKSKFHASQLGDIDTEKYIIIPNGGFKERVQCEKDPNYLIYASSYDRGLPYMLKWGYPKIKEKFPNVYLNIFYGWDLFDKYNADTEDVRLYKNIVKELMVQEGVKDCGRISQEQLLKEKAKASIHYYVGDFQEIDCISVRESISQYTIPVVSDSCLVFREKEYCTLIEGEPRIKDTQEKGAEKIIDILSNLEQYRNSLKLPASETWENVAVQWLNLF
jgi:hypothetical protein